MVKITEATDFILYKLRSTGLVTNNINISTISMQGKIEKRDEGKGKRIRSGLFSFDQSNNYYVYKTISFVFYFLFFFKAWTQIILHSQNLFLVLILSIGFIPLNVQNGVKSTHSSEGWKLKISHRYLFANRRLPLSFYSSASPERANLSRGAYMRR